MIKTDRTVKILLGLIALLLVALMALVARPRVGVETPAQAQQVTAPNEATIVGYRTQLLSSVALRKDKSVREMAVIQNANAFVVRYDGVIDVYRIDELTDAEARVRQ